MTSETAPVRDGGDADLDRAACTVAGRAAEWLAVPVAEKAALLRAALAATARIAPRQVRAACDAKGIAPGSPTEGEEWLGGIVPQLRTLRRMAGTLAAVAATGTVPVPAERIAERAGGRLAVGVLPDVAADRLLFPGFRAEVRLDGAVTRANLREHVGGCHTKPGTRPAAAVVLGAGNVASIGALDAVHKLFVEGRTAVLKLNPVNDYLAPFVEEAFAPLVEGGFLRVVRGGADAGALLCTHPRIDEIHVTGSAATHDAIVWGTGAEAAERRARGEPRTRKRVTSELGNVTPVIVVPGRWSLAALRFHAENVATEIVQNGGFNCNAAKVLVLHDGWAQRGKFLDALRAVLRSLPPRRAWYPGARARFERFVAAAPAAELLGEVRGEDLPPALLTGLDPGRRDTLAFREESFCALAGVVELPGADAAAFLRGAVEFANETLFGTLCASVVVDPATRARLGGAFGDALDALRYGTVAVNHWPALGFALGGTTWGAYPGHTLADVGSGIGWVHGAWLLDRPEKSVVEGPFFAWPKPPWFVTHRRAHEVARRLAAHEAAPSLANVPGIAWQALRG